MLLILFTHVMMTVVVSGKGNNSVAWSLKNSESTSLQVASTDALMKVPFIPPALLPSTKTLTQTKTWVTCTEEVIIL